MRSTTLGRPWSSFGVLLLTAAIAGVSEAQSRLGGDDFESGLGGWTVDSPEGGVAIAAEPGTDNHVLLLTPTREEFTHAILSGSDSFENVRVRGRFLFPEDGHGYLGFIYNHRRTDERLDFGCVYVKSNGSYIRISPHHDGNPSWRLYEELRVDLDGERRIQVDRWYEFQLDVAGRRAAFFIDDLTSPVVTFDLFPRESGGIGFEARPGGGAPVWVDDVVVTSLPPSDAPGPTEADAARWEILGPFGLDRLEGMEAPELPEEGWKPLVPDPRGALITGFTTQYRSGEQSVAFLRRRFALGSDEASPVWLAASSANRLDVWLNGYFRGTVAEERFIWSDYLTSKKNPGARLPLIPRKGENEIVIRLHGDNFAGGGLFLDLIER